VFDPEERREEASDTLHVASDVIVLLHATTA
jgi:hypothetical protein